MYSVKLDRGDKEIKKIKGVKGSITARLGINDFRKCSLEKRLHQDSSSIFTIYK